MTTRDDLSRLKLNDMKIYKLKSSDSFLTKRDIFTLLIGINNYNFGLIFHKWGFRILLIWWHIIIHYK